MTGRSVQEVNHRLRLSRHHDAARGTVPRPALWATERGLTRQLGLGQIQPWLSRARRWVAASPASCPRAGFLKASSSWEAPNWGSGSERRGVPGLPRFSEKLAPSAGAEPLWRCWEGRRVSAVRFAGLAKHCEGEQTANPPPPPQARFSRSCGGRAFPFLKIRFRHCQRK